ncbi:MAG: hypothetical protein L0Z62_15665, partial [Gemmataceae bacterium]|nr:hypothetical protein [Gemmataceae bacterium]
MVLQYVLFVTWLYTLAVEFRWAGITLGLAVALAIGLAGFSLFWLMDDPYKQLALWVALVSLVSFLEWQECQVEAPSVGSWRVAVLIGFLAAVAVWYVLEHSPGWVGFAVVLALMAGGRSEPGWRLRRAEETIQKQLDAADPWSAQPANLIAHSLGTYLSGNLFLTYPFPWNQVVFLGGVISEDYDWNALPKVGPDPFIKEVRNEHGGWDRVVWLIRLSGEWGRQQGLGLAGRDGFNDSKTVPVHAVKDVLLACSRCLAGATNVYIHNYQFRRYRHSSYFLQQHARTLWLPFFWGLVP